jgi:6-phosphogluconolactonase
MTSRRELEIRDSPQDVAKSAADLFASLAETSARDRGAFRVALSGGSTPKLLYAVLASDEYRGRIDWAAVHIFFSDERFVPPSSSESNFHTARVGLLSQVPIPDGNVHPVPTVGLQPAGAAKNYENTIRDLVPGDPLPRFDLIFLGMGPDGHTASLFPDTEALGVTDRLVTENYVPKLDTWRITFTYPLLDAGQVVAFLVAGEDKNKPAAEIMSGHDYPAGRVSPSDGRLIWFLDAAAARTGR